MNFLKIIIKLFSLETYDDDEDEEESHKKKKKAEKRKSNQSVVKSETENASPTKRKKKDEEEQEVWKWLVHHFSGYIKSKKHKNIIETKESHLFLIKPTYNSIYIIKLSNKQ